MFDKLSIHNNTYSGAGNIPAPALHVLLERMIQDWLEHIRQGLVIAPRYQSLAYTYTTTFQVKNQLKNTSSRGKALCLLKTQFAKKPKNPV